MTRAVCGVASLSDAASAPRATGTSQSLSESTCTDNAAASPRARGVDRYAYQRTIEDRGSRHQASIQDLQGHGVPVHPTNFAPSSMARSQFEAEHRRVGSGVCSDERHLGGIQQTHGARREVDVYLRAVFSELPLSPDLPSTGTSRNSREAGMLRRGSLPSIS